jgi:hypothetical protein
MTQNLTLKESPPNPNYQNAAPGYLSGAYGAAKTRPASCTPRQRLGRLKVLQLRLRPLALPMSEKLLRTNPAGEEAC